MAGRVLDLLETLRLGTRFAADLPKLLPHSRCSPGLLLERWARETPDNPALAYADERYTWRELDERANRYAAWFASQGVGRDDVVALVMENRPDFLFILMGLGKLGAITSLINTNVTGAALVHGISVCGARKILVGGERLESVREVLGDLGAIDPEKDVWIQTEAVGTRGSINADVARARAVAPPRDRAPSNRDVFCYIYTSGTTGLPKAAIIRNQRILAAGFAFGRLMHRSAPGDVIYVPLPLYHSSAMFLGWGAALATGASVALRRRFSVSSFWNDVRDFRATSFIYIGELCRYLLNAPPTPAERDHGLRVAVGNGMGPDIWEAFQERFGIPVVREFYGATEGNAPILNYSGRPRMVGRLNRGQAILRCDPATGEVIRNARGFCEWVRPGESGLLVGRISSVVSFDGYVDESATAKKILRNVFRNGDRYFDSGDLLQLHAGRWISFVDRVGDTFRWKGENVSTAEVSAILGGAPGVLEANVYGVRVPGADGRAGMVALAVDDRFDLAGFAAYACSKLPGYQRPRFVRLLRGGMRITGTFKHQKVDYREEAFDPRRTDDPLYVLAGDGYLPVDGEMFDRIESGDFPVA